MQNTITSDNQQELHNGDISRALQEQSNSPQFSWITDTIVVNGNPVRVIFPRFPTPPF